MCVNCLDALERPATVLTMYAELYVVSLTVPVLRLTLPVFGGAGNPRSYGNASLTERCELKPSVDVLLVLAKACVTP